MGWCIQQARLPPNNAGRPLRQFKCPIAWLEWRARWPPGVYGCGVGGWVGWEGWRFLTKDESPHTGYTFTPWVVSFTPPSIYTSDNIYANCQSSVGYLVGCFKIQTFLIALWPFTYLWCMPKETHIPNFSIIVRVWSQSHRPPHPPHTPTHPHPHQNCPRALQVGSFCGELIGEEML